MSFLERLIVSFGTGYIVTQVSKQNGVIDEIANQRGVLAGLGTFVLTEDEPKNTHNYTLYRNGKRVYDGITKENRIPFRLKEHTASGKKFDNVKVDPLKTYEEAVQLEKKRIRRFKPEYNIHHNR